MPCKPCEEVFPDPVDECSDPPREDCTTTDLRLQLDALQRCISSQKGEKQKIDAEIAAREAREGELKTLIDGFDKIVTTYKAKRQDLICTEDCLKGFYRDVTRVFKDKYKFPERCLKEMRDAINGELCTVEKEKCCYNNLVGKLEKVTKLIWVRDEAKRRWEKADSAFKDLQRFDAWIGEQFALLEKWKKEINDKLISNDPNDHKKAFYIFYWKFAPAFCNRFAVAFCCEKKESEHPDRSGEQRHSEGHPTYHIGCEPGDWHPSVITVEKLTKLICCAWDYVHELKQAYHDANDRVVAIEHNRDYVALRITAHDEKVIDQNITNLLNAVDCKAAPCAD